MSGLRTAGSVWLLLAACSSGSDGDHDAESDAATDARTSANMDATVASPPCAVSDSAVRCEARMLSLSDGAAERSVYWQAPITPTPPEGRPFVVIFQGSLADPGLTWTELTPAAPFGGFHQGLLQAALLEAGFVVVAPAAAGGIGWTTNVADYETSTDRTLVLALIAAIEGGELGAPDLDRVYATGISSGGYMTSHMAVSHSGVFAALAIQSGSYATCLGPICELPTELPADHPPTLFLHGEQDAIVPVATARAYHEALQAQGVDTEMIVDPAAGHAWLDVAPERVGAWFETH